MSSRLAAFRVVPVRWPLRRPFVTALGRKTFSDNVLVQAVLAGGAAGWGEASSSLAVPAQTGPRMAAALRRLGECFLGRDARDAEKLSAEAWRLEPETPAAVAAFEAALWDALARAEGVPFFRLWGPSARPLETLMSIPAVDSAQVAARAREGRRRGFRALKLKLNGREGEPLNLERLRAAHRAAPRARLLLDPNQSYVPDTLSSLLAAADRDGLPVDLVEEPFPKRDWRKLAAFRGRSAVPLILDESVQTPADAHRAAAGKLSRGVNVKLAKSGIVRTLAILSVFEDILLPPLWGKVGMGGALKRRFPSQTIPRPSPPPQGGREENGCSMKPLLMIGCMAESKVGLAAAAQFAMGLGVFDFADLDSDLLLKPLSIPGGYVRRGPWLSLPRNPPPGLGVSWGRA